MKKAFKLPYIVTSLVLVFLIMQVFRIDKTKPEVNTETDYITIAQPPAEIAALIKSGCYDCHSNETIYPWYSNIAPVSWILKSHINEGRSHLNFSEWGNYQPGKRGSKHDECKEMLVEDEMPLLSYKLMHTSAKYTEVQKTMLVKWFTNE